MGATAPRHPCSESVHASRPGRRTGKRSHALKQTYHYPMCTAAHQHNKLSQGLLALCSWCPGAMRLCKHAAGEFGWSDGVVAVTPSHIVPLIKAGSYRGNCEAIGRQTKHQAAHSTSTDTPQHDRIQHGAPYACMLVSHLLSPGVTTVWGKE